MAKMYLMGIDVGTSRVKVVLFDTHGVEVAITWRDINLHRDGTRTELDMNELWNDVAVTIRDTINGLESESVVVGVCVSGQGEGLWLIDGNGYPVCRAILWNDGRAGMLVNTLEKIPGLKKTARDITGSSLFPGAASVLLHWVQKYDPDRLRKAHHLIFCKDWIRYKLTGIIGTDWSDASTSLLNISKAEPSLELLRLLDIENCFTLIPKATGSFDQAGVITLEAAELTGLESGTNVATGSLDIVATAIGCGAVRTGDACTILGTTGCNMVVKDTFQPGSTGRSGVEIHAIPGQFLSVSASMAATPNLDWIYGLFHKGKSFDDVEKNLKNIPAGSGGIIYHPYISCSGERSPFYSPGARAQFTGITGDADPLTLTRAVYEGVALSVRDCLEGQNIDRLFLGGGGARSRLWAKIIADCIGIPVYLSPDTELCAKGSAMMAGIVSGVYNNLEEGMKSVKDPERIEPDQENLILYNSIYKNYRKIREVMIEIWETKEI